MDDRLLTLLGSLVAALLGGGIVNAVLQRRTGKETVANAAVATQLDQQTKRLDGEIEVLKTLYEASARRLDKTEADLAVEQGAHVQCEAALAKERAQREREVKHLNDEVAWMRKALQRGGGDGN
jgi:uncharacterized membrane-anchored protein YhcB (DUF1043 family)